VNDLTKIVDFLNDFVEALFSRKIIELAAQGEIRMMKERIRAWRTLTGAPMKPYSNAYRKRRVELGLAIQPMGSNTDSILVADSYAGMISRIESILGPRGNEAFIDITSPAKKKLAAYHNFLGVGKKGQNLRPFWGITPDEKEKIADLIGEQCYVVLADLVEKYNAM
jgi:hypothetical protein